MRKNILRITLFFLLHVVAIVFLLYLIPTSDDKIRRVEGYKLQENENLDVIAMGNSDLYSGFIPAVVYKKTNIKSYNCGESGQNLGKTFSHIKDMFKYQNPQLILIETDVLNYKIKYDRKSNIFENLYTNHDFWRQHKGNKIIKQKGYVYSNKVKPYMNNDKYMMEGNNKIADENLELLSEIISFCKEKNTLVLLVEFPSTTTWNNIKSKQMIKFSEDNDVDFIDFNINTNEYGIDLKTCTRDGGNHLNFEGAKLVTEYLCEYIVNHYNIQTNDKNSENWQKSVAYFEAVNNIKL